MPLTRAAVNAISADPDAPHFFRFRGKRTLLLAAAEHYGSAINKGFDFVAYLDTLAEHGANYTRIYPGALFEIPGYFVEDNVLGPSLEELILPWARSDVPGASQGNKFDLDTWDEEYFARLDAFLEAASQRGIVVEICFFNAMYADGWPHQALNAVNNIQAEGTAAVVDFQTLSDPPLNQRQEDYVREITRRVNHFDNVILEIIDEPTLFGTDEERASHWINRMLEAVIDEEYLLPNKHMIAQQIVGQFGGPLDFSADPRIAVATGQYVSRNYGNQIGGQELLDSVWRFDKPIEMNESAYFPNWYEKDDPVSAVRVDAWEFVVGGGAGYNCLTAHFNNKNPSGKGTDTIRLLEMLAQLRAFMESFDYGRMRPWIPITEAPDTGFMRGMAEAGRQYMLYIHHSKLIKRQRYYPSPGHYENEFAMAVPPGRYTLTWIDPASLKVIATETVDHDSHVLKRKTPLHTVDIALRIIVD
ncbi:MAG: hypothetical protein ABL879_08575 [Devosia sp.]